MFVLEPKDVLAGASTAKPSFSMQPIIELSTIKTLYFMIGVTLNEGLAVMVPAKPSFGITPTKDVKPFFCVAWLTWLCL